MNQTLVIEVTGLPGAGCATLAHALTVRFGVIARTTSSGSRSGDSSPPDLMIRVIGAQARAADRRAIAASEIPVLVVAGKADTREHKQPRRDYGLEQAVFPVSGLLAGVVVDHGEMELLSAWHRDGLSLPVAAAAFTEQPQGARMLSKYGRSGLVQAIELAGDPGWDAERLTAELRAASGIDALVEPIRAAAPQIAAGRRAHRLSGLRLLAARGFDRTAAELRLVQESTS